MNVDIIETSNLILENECFSIESAPTLDVRSALYYNTGEDRCQALSGIFSFRSENL